jgi:RNA polymerase sigma factor (sigma-70 family)
MDEDFFYQDYLNWRKTGVEFNKIKDLIHLHFYFRALKKLEIKGIYQEHFSESASEIESGVSEFQVFSKKILLFREDVSFDIDHDELGEESSENIISEQDNIENDLIIGLAIGDSSAFEEIYENEYPKIRDYVIKNSGSSVDAQDIFQDGVVVLLEKVKTPEFEFTCKVGTYLYSCCRNLWLKQLRKSNGQINSEYYEIYEVEDVSLLEEPENYLEKLAPILSKLSESCLKLFQAFYYECKTWETIAHEFGYNTINSAKNQKYKCLKKIVV